MCLIGQVPATFRDSGQSRHEDRSLGVPRGQGHIEGGQQSPLVVCECDEVAVRDLAVTANRREVDVGVRHSVRPESTPIRRPYAGQDCRGGFGRLSQTQEESNQGALDDGTDRCAT